MTIQQTPTLPELKAWLGLAPDDTADDDVLQVSLDASLAQQALVVDYPITESAEQTFTHDLREAIFLRSQRLAARRNSPEGIVGLNGLGGDFAAARVPAYDADVYSLEAPHRKIPVA